jgi:hypothetical protein
MIPPNVESLGHYEPCYPYSGNKKIREKQTYQYPASWISEGELMITLPIEMSGDSIRWEIYLQGLYRMQRKHLYYRVTIVYNISTEKRIAKLTFIENRMDKNCHWFIVGVIVTATISQILIPA